MPAATLVIVGGIALFFALALAYSWPVLSEPVPVDAPEDWVAQRVRARLVESGLIYPMLAGSFVVVGILVSRWTRR